MAGARLMRRMTGRGPALALAALLALGGPGGIGAALAQGADAPGPEGILVLNQDQFYALSAFGQRVEQDLEAAGEALIRENRRIEGQLTAEEQALTERRATLAPEEFRLLADEFDTRVGEIRAAQDRKAQNLNLQAETARQRFFELAFPILLDLVQERGAAVIVDSRSVLLSAESVDITQDAIARIDRLLGAGRAELPGLGGLPDPGPQRADPPVIAPGGPSGAAGDPAP